MNEKELKEIFRQLDDTPLPHKEKMLSACEVGFEKLDTEKKVLAPLRSVRPTRRRLVAVCATLAALVSLSVFSVISVSAEQREYREAVAFFEEYDIPTDGYTRKEIKNICKDITSGSFTYELTPEAIKKSNILVEQIVIEDLSPEELKELWNKKAESDKSNLEEIVKGFSVCGRVLDDGVSFIYKNDVANGETIYDVIAILEKYKDGALEWSKTFNSTSISSISHTDEYIAISAVAPNESTDYSLIVLSQNGDELFRNSIDNIGSIIAEKDMITVISNSPLNSFKNKLFISEYDIRGKLLEKNSAPFSELGFGASDEQFVVLDALKLESYYFVTISNYNSGESFLARTDKNGMLEAKYIFNTEARSHKIVDVSYTDKDLYISGYYIPPEGDKYAIEALEKDILDAGGVIEKDELLEQSREIYTAFMFIFDIESSETRSFYTASGAQGGYFNIDENGHLVWNIKSVASVSYEYVPYYNEVLGDMSSASLNIAYSDSNYTFSQEGKRLD